jgi:hypothetical protein
MGLTQRNRKRIDHLTIPADNPNTFPFPMIRRIAISLVGGISITGALTALSYLFIRLLPYRDKPMMPKPFFLYALLPGTAAAESIEGHSWIRVSVFVITNSLTYACVLGMLLGTICYLLGTNAKDR